MTPPLVVEREDTPNGVVLRIELAAVQTHDSWQHVRASLDREVNRCRPQVLAIDLRLLDSLYGAPLVGVLVVGAAAMQKLGADRQTKIIATPHIAKALKNAFRIARVDSLFGGFYPDLDSALAGPDGTCRRQVTGMSGPENAISEPFGRWEQIGHHASGPLIALSFRGVYPPGSAGNKVAGAMVDFLRSTLAETRASGVLLDLTALDYVAGDAIGEFAFALMIDGKTSRPAAIVATGNTARALEPLVAPNFPMGVARMKLVQTRQEALAHIEQALADGPRGLDFDPPAARRYAADENTLTATGQGVRQPGFRNPELLIVTAFLWIVLSVAVPPLASRFQLSPTITLVLIAAVFALPVLGVLWLTIIVWRKR